MANNKTLDFNSKKFMINGKQDALINFKKAHSHLGNLIQMTEDGEYCINIMQQNLAVVGLLKSAHQILMENHLKTCFKTAMDSKNNGKKNQMTQEILQVTKLFNK